MHRTIDAKTACQIYDILVATGCAEERDIHREDFVRAVSGDCREYRFIGTLGFGGKFYNDHAWRVSCYREDERPARVEAIKEASRRIAELTKNAPD